MVKHWRGHGTKAIDIDEIWEGKFQTRLYLTEISSAAVDRITESLPANKDVFLWYNFFEWLRSLFWRKEMEVDPFKLQLNLDNPDRVTIIAGRQHC
jgi:hypothetical protein